MRMNDGNWDMRMVAFWCNCLHLTSGGHVFGDEGGIIVGISVIGEGELPNSWHTPSLLLSLQITFPGLL